MLQTIGDPYPTTEDSGDPLDWESVGEELPNFGGTPEVWNRLDGKTNYVLVGTVYGAKETRELHGSSSVEGSAQPGSTGTPAWVGTAHGLWGRGVDSLPMIAADDPGPQANPGELTVLAEEEPRAWPYSEPTDEAALVWISRKLKLGNPEEVGTSWCSKPETWDVRAEYCDRTLHSAWSSVYLPDLKTIATECSTAGSSSFGTGECEAVAGQLELEFEDIEIVHNLIEELKESFIEDRLANGNLFEVGFAKLEAEAKTERPEKIPVWVGDLLDGITTVTQDVEWTVPGFSVGAGILESALNFGLDEAEDEDGEPASSPFTVEERTKVGTEMVQRFEEAVEGVQRMEGLLLTDWNKLRTVAQKAKSTWGLNGETVKHDALTFKRGSELWLYETVVPGTYEQIQVPLSSPYTNFSGLTSLVCGWEGYEEGQSSKPFRGISEDGVLFPPRARRPR